MASIPRLAQRYQTEIKPRLKQRLKIDNRGCWHRTLLPFAFKRDGGAGDDLDTETHDGLVGAVD